MIFTIMALGPEMKNNGMKFSMGVSEGDYMTDGVWDAQKIGQHILYVLSREAGLKNTTYEVTNDSNTE